MSFFSKIKDAIFGKKAEAATPAPVETATPVSMPDLDAAAAAPVDVAASLGAMPGADNLNWKTSIVDLMKLVGIDSSYENRKALAEELGDSDYSGSAEENIALHKAVMRKLAENGGNVPADLLD